MRRRLFLGELLLLVVVLSLRAFGEVEAVAAPETQTVAINGAAAEFDGSGSTGEPYIQDWACDFDGDGIILP